jgi:two-component system, response regulator PdtaR
MSVSRILIVEDERLLSKDLARSLDNLGYEIAGMFTTGEEALQAAGTTKPDLILMDIKLAGELDGIETARLIREHHDTAIVYLTGYSEKTDLFERAKATEPYGYLGKPLSHMDLHRTVEMALYKHEMERR